MTVENMPEHLKKAIPPEGQGTFIKVFNALTEGGAQESYAYWMAFDSLWMTGFERKADGSYCKVEQSVYKRVEEGNDFRSYYKEGAKTTFAKAIAAMGREKPSPPVVRKVQRADGDGWEMDIPIVRTEDDKRLVFGWLSVAKDKDGNTVVDSHDDIIDIENLEEVVYNYVKFSRVGGDAHKTYAGVMVESVVFTKEKMESMGIPEGILPEAWWIGYYVEEEETWKKVKSGEYSMFSIGGRGTRSPA